MSKKKYKTWAQAKSEIEKVVNSTHDSIAELSLFNGFLHRHTISHFSSPIYSAAYRKSKKTSSEFFAINCVSPDSGEYYIFQWKYDASNGTCKITKKVTLRQCLKTLIYVPNQHAYVGKA